MSSRKYIEFLRRQQQSDTSSIGGQRQVSFSLDRPPGEENVSLVGPPPITDLLPSSLAFSSAVVHDTSLTADSATASHHGADAGSSSIEEHQTTDQHLARRLGEVRAIIDEFYDDFGMAISKKSEEIIMNTSHLQQVVSALRRVPILPDWQSQPEPRRTKEKVVRKDSILNLFSDLVDRDQDRRLLTLDLTLVILAALSIIIMIVADYLLWVVPEAVSSATAVTKTVTLHLPDPLATPSPPTTNIPSFTPAPAGTTSIENVVGSVQVSIVLILHYLIFVVSLGSVGTLMVYYRLRLKFLRQAWSKVAGKQVLAKSESFSFFRSYLLPQFASEAVVAMVMPYPWYNQINSQNAKYLQIFMFFRLYHIFRFLYHYSNLYRNRNLVKRTSDYLRRVSFTVDFVDAMKVYFFEYTVITSALLYGSVILIGGFCVFVAERNSNSNSSADPKGTFGFSSFFNGVYFMVISIRTIGYGDIKPVTVVGRAVTVIFQFVGVTVESLIASVVVNKIAKTKEDKIAEEHLETFAAWLELRVCSAMVIQAFWKTSLRYKYLHRKASEEAMQAILRSTKRRKDYLHVLQLNRAKNAVRDMDGSNIAFQLRDEQASVASDASLKQIVRYFASGEKMHRAKNGDGVIFGVFNMTQNLEEEREETYRRMPYLRERHVSALSTHDLIDRDRHMFTQNIDIIRWNRTFSSAEYDGFQMLRKFTSSKKVVGKFGERRVPIGQGHKADIRLEAVRNFREARRQFKRSIAPSSDHVIDNKMQVAYELLVAAAHKLRRNTILLQSLKRSAKLELQSLRGLVALSMSGGKPLPATGVEAPTGGRREE